MRNFVIISLVLVIIFVLVSKAGLYAPLIAKVSDLASKGFRVLTTGAA